MTDDTVIEDLGKWDWSLVVTVNNEVVARQPIPHDGVLTFSTKDRPTSSRANSQHRMAETRVVEQYATRSDTDREYDELLRAVREAKGGER